MKQLRIKTQRLSFSPNLVTLLVLVVVMLVLGASSTQAQTSTSTATADQIASTSPVVDSSITIAAKGSVSDPNGTITVTGDVIITARRVKDTTATGTAASPPIVVIDMDFSKLLGTSGNGKNSTSYITGDNHADEIRPLQSTDTIIVTCPYYDSTKDILSARTMLVTATLNFDTVTGRVTGGSITIGNNVVTSATVGTFTAN